eukprot:SAG25_NODE_742_length_5598_cov_36.107110_3_plen_85_part_00
MLHTIMPTTEVDSYPRDDLHVASINHTVQSGSSGDGDEKMVSVTLCGSATAVAEFVARHPEDSVELQPKHPWHHPMYADAISSR